MNIVLDMNLSPRLRRVLSDAGHNARHWSEVGGHDDADPECESSRWMSENLLLNSFFSQENT